MTNAGSSSHPYFALDDVGCNGSESNLLHCLPQHNCGQNRGAENAGVLCLRKGEHIVSMPIIKAFILPYFHYMDHFRSQTRAWFQPRKQ